MSSEPQLQPLTYTDGGVYAPPETYAPRPSSLTVVATLGIVLGALGLICRPLSLMMFVVKLPVQDPVVEAMRGDSFVRGWMVIGVATEWVISLLLLMASVGSLRLRDWGRTGMLAYAPLKLVMTVVSQVIGVVAITPALEPAMRQAAAEHPSALRIPPMTMAVLMTLWGTWFPLLVLWAFTRKPVKEAFNEGAGTAGAGAAV